jgi:glycogen synthase
LRNKKVKHAVINTNAQNTLRHKYNVESIIVPNVMDFSEQYAEVTEKNKSFLEDLGLDKNDIPILQVTRIVKRKGIETAI